MPETALIIALITGLLGIFTGVLSLLVNLMVIRRSAQINTRLEEVRIAHERAETFAEFNIYEHMNMRACVKVATSKIQVCRDELRRVLSEIQREQSIDDKEILYESCQDIRSFYSDELSTMDRHTRKLMHEAKNLVGDVRYYLENNKLEMLGEIVSILSVIQQELIAQRSKISVRINEIYREQKVADLEIYKKLYSGRNFYKLENIDLSDEREI